MMSWDDIWSALPHPEDDGMANEAGGLNVTVRFLDIACYADHPYLGTVRSLREHPDPTTVAEGVSLCLASGIAIPSDGQFNIPGMAVSLGAIAGFLIGTVGMAHSHLVPDDERVMGQVVSLLAFFDTVAAQTAAEIIDPDPFAEGYMVIPSEIGAYAGHPIIERLRADTNIMGIPAMPSRDELGADFLTDCFGFDGYRRFDIHAGIGVVLAAAWFAQTFASPVVANLAAGIVERLDAINAQVLLEGVGIE